MKVIPFVRKNLNSQGTDSLEKIQNLASVLIQKTEKLKQTVDLMSEASIDSPLVSELKNIGIQVEDLNKRLLEEDQLKKVG